MRWKFWQSEEASDAPAPAAVALSTKSAPASASASEPAGTMGDLDLRQVWNALARKKAWIIVPTAIVAALSFAAVNVMTPRYKSEARILLDAGENVFLRPSAERVEDRGALDTEAITSQVQIILSRDLALSVIRKLKLNEIPEFDPVLRRGVSPLRAMLAMLGIVRDPLKLTAEERVLESYYDRLTAYAVERSRVIAIDFQSGDPDLAASVANAVADGYLAMQQAARQDQARSAGQWLEGEIEDLRKKVTEAEARVENFRSRANLFVGANNTTLSNQQMAEINTQLSAARAQKSDAESKARLIRSMLQSGRPIEASEVLNSELVRRLSEQRATLLALLAEQSSTLLGNHPRIKELRAQIADLNGQLRDEASKISRSLENDARIAGGRAESMSSSLDQLKKQAASTNSQDVQLRALEREARAQRELLESYLARFREATTRENLDIIPSEARIISRAIASHVPAFPKKLPIVLIATLATLMLSAGSIITGELLKMTAPRADANTGTRAPVAAAALPPVRDTHPEIAAPISDLERIAAELRALGGGARKITVIGVARSAGTSLTALTLARLLVRDASVVLVDLSMASATIKAVMADPAVPGLSDLVQGTASFGQLIGKDRMSRVQIVGAGTGRVDAAMLQSPRLAMTIDALMRVYDYVVLNAGSLDDIPEHLVAANAHAVLIATELDTQTREVVRNELLGAGFRGVTMLDAPVDPSQLGRPGGRAAA